MTPARRASRWTIAVGVAAAIGWFAVTRLPDDRDALTSTLPSNANVVVFGRVPGGLTERVARVSSSELQAARGPVAHLCEELARRGATHVLTYDPRTAASLTRAIVSSQRSCLRGLVVSRDGAVFGVRVAARISEVDARALLHVARGVLLGSRPPRLASFPESLRAIQSVEVLLALRERGRLRLWRSARASSIARGLLTAATVAKDRWREREGAMGTSLRDALTTAQLEVALLEDHGTVIGPDRSWIDRAVPEGYGVGFDTRDSWRYVLPEALLREGRRDVMAELGRLLDEGGLDLRAVGRPGVRVYRFAVSVVASEEGASEAGRLLDRAALPASSAGGSRTTNVEPSP